MSVTAITYLYSIACVLFLHTLSTNDFNTYRKNKAKTKTKTKKKTKTKTKEEEKKKEKEKKKMLIILPLIWCFLFMYRTLMYRNEYHLHSLQTKIECIS